jgi:outer membrane protein OmpA-like peptidoglycan-associated protein
MSTVRASNPTSSLAPSKKSGGQAGSSKQGGRAEGTTSSDYLEQTRRDNPEPDKTTESEVQIKLSECKFVTVTDDLGIEKEFEAECVVEWQGENQPKVKDVFFAVKMSWQESGKLHEEVGAEEFPASLNMSSKSQKVKITATLPRPPSFPEAGITIKYKLVASHAESSASSESESVELPLLETLHYVEVPDILFALGGHFPCLDDNKALVDALTRSVKWSQEHPDEQLVVFGHADTSGDHPINYDISERRAQAALALLAHDGKIWEDLAKNRHKIEEIQRCLKTLTTSHGWSCDPGGVDDQDGPKTQGAVKKFQERCNQKYKLGLNPDGVAGPLTWKAVHRVICGLVAEGLSIADPDSATYPSWDVPKLGYSKGKGIYGCGESFPVDRATVDGLKSEENRRVDFLFCLGWSFLKPVNDRARALTKEECPAYDRAKMKWVPIHEDSVGGGQWVFSE